MTRAVLIDYGSGNLRSAAKAFEHAAGSGATVEVSNDPKALERATHVVLPGVGAFADCMRGLKAVPGMVDALEDQVIARGKPFLGICVGMQLMAARGLEYGVHPGLGWIPGDVRAIEPTPERRVPHMGWNELAAVRPHPVLAGLGDGEHVYFVHSYHLVPQGPDAIMAVAEYGEPIVAAVGRDNLFGTQFHPEKSQAAGLRLVANFLAWRP